MQVINQFKRRDLEAAFNVYFLSAKFGLIRANEQIDNYEQKLDEDRITAFKSDKYL